MPTELRVTRSYSGWITPAQAVQILESAFGTDSHSYIAKLTLLERLRGGTIRAMAEDTHVSDNEGGEHTEKLAEIPKTHWTHVDANSTLWTTSHVTYQMSERSGYGYKRITIRLYHVRFDPEAVRATVPPSSDQPLAEAPEVSKGKPISEADLKRWAELYKDIYGGTETDTLDFAWRSAQGMFPNKSVARDRVRALVGGNRKRGPKTDSAE